MQIDVHTKILDRMQSNEDLLAYVQTPAGRNFLEFAPAGPGPEPRVASAPFGRILWSVQAGVVLAALGIGLRFAQGTVPEEIIPAFTVLGIIVMSLGSGCGDLRHRCLRPVVPVRLVAEPQTRNQCVK